MSMAMTDALIQDIRIVTDRKEIVAMGLVGLYAHVFCRLGGNDALLINPYSPSWREKDTLELIFKGISHEERHLVIARDEDESTSRAMDRIWYLLDDFVG